MFKQKAAVFNQFYNHEANGKQNDITDIKVAAGIY